MWPTWVEENELKKYVYRSLNFKCLKCLPLYFRDLDDEFKEEWNFDYEKSPLATYLLAKKLKTKQTKRSKKRSANEDTNQEE